MTIEIFSTQQVFSRILKVQTTISHVTKPMQSCSKFSNECGFSTPGSRPVFMQVIYFDWSIKS